MYLLSSEQKARTAAFENVQVNTLDCLRLAGVRADLGERALALEALITNMYPVNLKDGVVSVPKSEQQHDNTGVLALLPNDQDQIELKDYYAQLMGSEITKIYSGYSTIEAGQQKVEKIAQYIVQSRRPYTLAHKALAIHISSILNYKNGSNSRATVAMRPLIILGKQVPSSTKGLQSAALGHEADHVLFVKERGHDALHDDKGTNVLGLVKAERLAYRTGYALLKHTGELEGLPSVDTIAGITSEERDNLLNTIPHDSGKWGTLAAMSITLAYTSDMDSQPTFAEFNEYVRYGLINIETDT